MEIPHESGATTTPMATKRRKKKASSKEGEFSHALHTCAKSGDLSAALALFDSAVTGGGGGAPLRLTAHHFNSLLHLCSAAAESLGGDEPSRRSAVDAGFRVFDRMVAAGVAPTEATITSVARIAAQKPHGGDIAFELVETMGEKYGVAPRLRTYGPALFAYCRGLQAEKAYAVEAHMASMGISPEEPEIAALLEVSTKLGLEEKVYHYLHRLRSTVKCVEKSTAEILERWFSSSKRAREVRSDGRDVGKVKDAVLINGGGWHGLACVDIGLEETQKFAESVASLAMERETKSNFRNFQEWLEAHNEYEAIIDGANVGLYQQNFADGGFSLSQLDAVVRELQTGSKRKWPLIVLHNKRVLSLIENPSNRQLIETWRAEGALYTTPSGSNDDWYWLYAAIKLKCLVVTNDEMRDHIFELLGRSLFPTWKERHQESETGSWHVPIDDNCSDERLRSWLCITRPRASEGHEEADVISGSFQLLTSANDEMSNVSSKNLNGERGVSNSSGPSDETAFELSGKDKTVSSKRKHMA
ncbi:proteinaceous RNase P 2 isoform X2 [Ananas comosus]|uniref:ribonuclease P n=1 Tax=Ananas comosus TaxID=4615 RepID=A0A6P5GQS0_ANACO|nr:proteinaceous RNase P 2 isoform X2 [Ananas comosus]